MPRAKPPGEAAFGGRLRDSAEEAVFQYRVARAGRACWKGRQRPRPLSAHPCASTKLLTIIRNAE